MQAAAETIPPKLGIARRPWIREATLSLIALRHAARIAGDREEERLLNKAVHRSARSDRATWLDNLVQEGTWEGVRKLKQPKKVQQGRLRSEEGEVVASECRAEAMASYLEKVQWCVRLAQAVDSPALGEELPVRLDSFSTEEVRRGIWKLRSQRAAGHDEIAPEYLKALLSNSEALSIMVEFLNKCWLQQEIPEDWHLAVVTAIHKKGRADLCENYRPISLLCIFYKLFAALVHRRLVEAGAEDRLSSSQFGFRSHRSTTDNFHTQA